MDYRNNFDSIFFHMSSSQATPWFCVHSICENRMVTKPVAWDDMHVSVKLIRTQHQIQFSVYNSAASFYSVNNCIFSGKTSVWMMGVSELFNLKQLHGNKHYFFLQNTQKKRCPIFVKKNSLKNVVNISLKNCLL